MLTLIAENWWVFLIAFLIGVLTAWWVWARYSAPDAQASATNTQSNIAAKMAPLAAAPAALKAKAEAAPKKVAAKAKAAPKKVAAAAKAAPKEVAAKAKAAPKKVAAKAKAAPKKVAAKAKAAPKKVVATAKAAPKKVAAKAKAAPKKAAATRKTPDDLQLLKGVGPKLNGLLASLGVTSFDQVANWSAADIRDVDSNLGSFAGRISRDNWVDQAKLLAKGDVTAFEKKYGSLGG